MRKKQRPQMPPHGSIVKLNKDIMRTPLIITATFCGYGEPYVYVAKGSIGIVRYQHGFYYVDFPNAHGMVLAPQSLDIPTSDEIEGLAS